MLARIALLGVALSVLSACTDEKKTTPTDDPPDSAELNSDRYPPVYPEQQGQYTVGTTRFELAAHDSRTLAVQLWYPADYVGHDEAVKGHDFADLEPPGERHDVLAQLVAAAPEKCTSRKFHAALNARPYTPIPGPWPVVLFSHCSLCARYSEEGVAERLASWGFVVAAPDHEGDTVYDGVKKAPSALTPEFLQTRGQDMKDVLDAILAGNEGVPEALRGHLDETRVGMFGHSFGSITTGLMLQDDPRVRVGVMLAAPPENPLLPGVTLANLTKPGFFFLAEEDNSIGAAGNQYIQQNYEDYPAHAYLLSVKDAGHWSFSDIAGMAEFLKPGCGQGQRQEDPSQTFDYLDNDTGRSIAQAYVTAFLARQLLNGGPAKDYLAQGTPEGVVTLTHR